MNKSIRKSLYLCAAALMIGGVAAPTVSNSISASAHSRTAISRYSHEKNVRKSDVKRLHHIQNVHKYHLRLEKEAKRNLAKHEKSLARYNHLIHVHKHNRKMINNLTRAKNKLIKMIKADQHGITRQASLVESEEHQIDLIKHGKIVPSNAKKGRHGHKGNYGGKGYDYWFNLGKHGRHNSKRNMNHWENRAYNAGYNAIHHKHHQKKNNNESVWNKLGYTFGHDYNDLGQATDELEQPMTQSLIPNWQRKYANNVAPTISTYNRRAFIDGIMRGLKAPTSDVPSNYYNVHSEADNSANTAPANYNAPASLAPSSNNNYNPYNNNMNININNNNSNGNGNNNSNDPANNPNNSNDANNSNDSNNGQANNSNDSINNNNQAPNNIIL